MTSQEILVKKRQAVFTVCKDAIKNKPDIIKEVFGGFEPLVEFCLNDVGKKIKRLNPDEYNEHQVINYICRICRSSIGREIHYYYQAISSPNTVHMSAIQRGDSEENQAELEEMSEYTDFASIDEKIDLQNIWKDVWKILEFEALNVNHKSVDYRVVLQQLMEVNWSPTEASIKFGGTKSNWNQRAKAVITALADTIRSKYPSYVESFPQLVGAKGTKKRTALTAENMENVRKHSRRKNGTTRQVMLRSDVITKRVLEYFANEANKANKANKANESEWKCNKQISEGSGINRTTAGNCCKQLVANGYLETTELSVKFGFGRRKVSSHYRITEKGIEFFKEINNG